MKIKLKDIINIQESYSRLLDLNYIPVKIRYSLSLDGETITNRIEHFFKLRDKAFKKYSSLPQSDENTMSYNLEINDLLDSDIDLLTEPFLTPEILLNEKSILTAKDMLLLKWLKVKPEEKEKTE